MSKEHIAKILKRLRVQSGKTADEIGALIGKSGKTVNAWENGRGQPDAEMLIKLCDLYNVDNILNEFREVKNDEQQINLTHHEQKLLTAYRSHPEMQPAIDKLLGVDNNTNCEIAKDMADTIKAVSAVNNFRTKQK